jgi:hypothetical protein
MRVSGEFLEATSRNEDAVNMIINNVNKVLFYSSIIIYNNISLYPALLNTDKSTYLRFETVY